MELITVAVRAGRIAGLDEAQATRCAELATADYLDERAERLRLSAQFADWIAYRARDERQADLLAGLAAELRSRHEPL